LTRRRVPGLAPGRRCPPDRTDAASTFTRGRAAGEPAVLMWPSSGPSPECNENSKKDAVMETAAAIVPGQTVLSGGLPFPQHAISIAPPNPPVIKPVVYCAYCRDLLYSCQSREAPVEPSEETGAGEANGRDGRWVGVRPRMRPPPLESGGSAPGALARPEMIGGRGPTENPAGRDAAKAPAAKAKGGV